VCHPDAMYNIFSYTTMELLSLTTQHATSKEAVGPLPVLGGRETAPDSSKETLYIITVQGAMKDAKGGILSSPLSCPAMIMMMMASRRTALTWSTL
jgi:hypothetical protein